MEAIGPVASIMSGFMQMQMGKAQQQVYNMQAKQAEMQAKSAVLGQRAEALNYKRQGQIAMISSFASAAGQSQQAGMFDPGFKFTNPFG